MNIRKCLITSLILLIGFTPFPLSLKGQENQENVVRIDIEGNTRVEANIIKINISSKVGEPLSPETVREDI